MVQDAETGECWSEQQLAVVVDLEDKPPGCPMLDKYSNHSATLNRWKIPKEHSNLGSSSSFLPVANTPLTIDCKISEETFHQTWTCETNTASNSSTIVATFPGVGKLPSLFRKRRSSPPEELATKKREATRSGKKKHFLEGRERLLLAGSLLFAIFILLSPLLSPFFTFFLRVGKYCHYQCHSANREVSLLKLNKGPVTTNLFTLDFMRMFLCRICREEFHMEMGLRIHSSLKTKSTNSNHVTYQKS